jgi:hypothetical protein
VWQRWREQGESELIRLKFRVQSLDFAIRDWNLWFSERDWNLTRETREVRVHRAVRDSSVSEKWVYREWELGRSWSNERSVMMVRAEIDSGGSESILQLGFAMCERDEIVFFFFTKNRYRDFRLNFHLNKNKRKFTWRLFTSEDIVVRCNINIDNFTIIIGLPPRLLLHLKILCPDVKRCVYLFFTSGKIETRYKKYSLFLFTSDISFTDVNSILISQICSSGSVFH